MEKRTQILPGVYLTCRQTAKFKTACLSVSLIRPLDIREASMNALLPAVLMRGTEKHPDIPSISAFLDEHYGASAGMLVRKNGEVQTTGFYFGFMEDRFALPGENILEAATRFAGELLLEPRLENGVFCRDFVEGEKENLINAIESDLNDKRIYADQKMMKLLCGGDGYAVPRLGTAESVKRISARSLYDHYRRILKRSRIELFYCGSAPEERVGSLLKDVFSGLGTESPDQVSMTAFVGGMEPRYGQETMDVAQGKLSMGFSTGCTVRDESFPAMMVLNACYGAGVTSKLFMNVRERLSLCYYADSAIHGSKGLMTVSSGVDSGNFERAKAEILAQLDACRRGELTAEELEAGKKAIISGLDTMEDSPGRMEDFALYRILSGQEMDIPAYRAAVEKVCAADVAKAAGKLRLEAVFFLKGEQK